ncbi:unnamed protein product [Adineta steineri]|uniref:F-box domain-containing protein n=1 Tax=Adineta steineri TaxID=433720 RepID=A0A815ZQY7_9BILA|nr:unnamed protein product [Adineta steineri]CAF1586370.1 unnamed protein product [Adineta steineri]
MSTITTIEDFSNEIFYEIFEYLYGNDIYEAFSILNSRFQQLLHCPFLQYKIRLDDRLIKQNTVDELKQISHVIKNYIFSISIRPWRPTTEIISLCNFDSSYQNLHCLIFNINQPNIILLILPKLTQLPKLYSLTIENIQKLKIICKIYPLVLNLSKLKYFKIETCCIDLFADHSLPIATHEQSSSIEHLIIEHYCSVQELVNFLYYTPKVHHLKFSIYEDKKTHLNLLSLNHLRHLTSLSIEMCSLKFDKFEILINQFKFHLKTFSLRIWSRNENYLNARRWERIILQNLPQLEHFSMKYIICFQNDDQSSLHSDKSNEFLTSFWLQRQWLLRIEMIHDFIIYIVDAYKKQWFEYDRQEQKIYSVEELSKSRQLIINNISVEILNNIHNYMNYVLSVMQIDHLVIKEEIFVIQLAEILCLLPELDSLEVSMISFVYPRQVTLDEMIKIFCSTTHIKISKLRVRKINKIEEINFFLAFCPLIKQLEINKLPMINVEFFLRPLLIQIRNKSKFQNLRLICIQLPTADDKMILKLKQMIQDENLLVDFKIKRNEEKIFVEWK